MYNSESDTKKHIEIVGKTIKILVSELEGRAKLHDQSKFRETEKPIYDEYTPKLQSCEYGSDEYKDYLKQMGIALEHHYEMNRHHPEHFKDGVRGMNLIDVVEMLADWKAASIRNGSNIIESIDNSQKRFRFSDDLKQIFINTINYLDMWYKYV